MPFPVSKEAKKRVYFSLCEKCHFQKYNNGMVSHDLGRKYSLLGINWNKHEAIEEKNLVLSGCLFFFLPYGDESAVTSSL